MKAKIILGAGSAARADMGYDSYQHCLYDCDCRRISAAAQRPARPSGRNTNWCHRSPRGRPGAWVLAQGTRPPALGPPDLARRNPGATRKWLLGPRTAGESGARRGNLPKASTAPDRTPGFEACNPAAAAPRREQTLWIPA
ncbi:hypothetical protein P7K49_035167 [Saguinus oedipus]|uniref:Uncharacterized protein n=1 Tax=Saguinus oedipus TaxID=9490 RepID=A0ABQ9TXP4_SAGOE|nr:hypothetical protein P7K49_035167 [Saguinus oedipus]